MIPIPEFGTSVAQLQGGSWCERRWLPHRCCEKPSLWRIAYQPSPRRSSAGTSAAQGRWREVGDAAASLLVEMGRRSLDVRNGFGELAWNRGGIAPIPLVVGLLRRVVPKVDATALRALLVSMDVRVGGLAGEMGLDALKEEGEREKGWQGRWEGEREKLWAFRVGV